MKTRIISLILILALLPSCALFQNINVNQGKILVKAASRTGTVACLTTLLQQEEDRRTVAAAIKAEIVNNVVPLLDGENLTLNPSTANLLFAKVPPFLRPFLGDAFDVLIGYKVLDDDVFSPEAVILIKAFFQGIIEGCDLILGGQDNATVVTSSNQPVAFICETQESS
jgi:hypothetical protein